jgi:hypothetical protein
LEESKRIKKDFLFNRKEYERFAGRWEIIDDGITLVASPDS